MSKGNMKMFAVNTYEEIEARQRKNEDQQIIVLLFVRPTAPGAMEIIKEFDYIHHNSGRYCSIYAVGYTDDHKKENDNTYIKASGVAGDRWYFSNVEFVEFKNNLEKRIKWRYSGENEMIILQSNPQGRQILNFQNYVAIDITHGIRKGYVISFQRFMESLIRSARSEVTAKTALAKSSRLSIKDVISIVVDECKHIPTPVKKILKDRVFYAPSLCASNVD